MEMLGRRALWEVGLNYGHGTGHGVGNYFGVHECMDIFFLFFSSLFFKQLSKNMVLEQISVAVIHYLKTNILNMINKIFLKSTSH